MVASNKNIPALRFKEFVDKWDNDRLINLTSILRCGIAATPTYVTIGVPFLSAQNVTKLGKISLEKYSLISEDYYRQLSKNHKLLKGDILYSRVGAGFGTAAVFPFDGDFGVYVSLTHIRTNFRMINFFLKFYLNSEFGKVQASNGVFQGGGVPNLNVKIVERFKINFPSLPEQQKIASFLSSVDEKIQQLTRKKELLEQYKKGVMQQLFSGKLRFKDEHGKDYPEWEEKRLGEVGELISGLTYNPSDINDGGVLVLRSSNVQDRRLVFDDNVFVKVYNFNPVQENDILICVRNGSKNLIGKNALIDKKNTGHAFGAFMTVYRSHFNNYLFHFFDTDVYKNEIHKNLGATINSINGGDLKKFKIPFPSGYEQQKIAAFLSNIDTKIKTVTTQITQTQTFKKGLLQQMFV